MNLLDSALHHLTKAGLHIERIDSFLRVGDQIYEVQVKQQVSPSSAAAILPAARGRVLMVTPFVSEAVGAFWRSQDIHYVDSVGNMYLRGDGVFVDVRGRPRSSVPRPAQPGRPLRLFKQSGLKILFAILTRPGLAEVNMREIAMATGSSLGTVHWIFKELEESGFLDSRRLVRTRDLFNRWVNAYTLELSPRLTLGRFDTPDPMWWSKADDALHAEGAQWGGETAAHHLNPRLRPGRAILYAASVPARLAVDFRFRKAEGEGNVEVRQQFWRPDEESLLVPTPLIFADLIASADPRQLEAATDLRDKDALLRRIDRG